MESHLAIQVEKLRKEYRKGTLDPFLKQLGNLFRGKDKKGTRSTTIALDDINFSLEKGAALGLIGKNGSGKSTLLKILSGVTTPSSGRALLRGRRLSILEIGTGFHPDLTGRENVYLNGAINGLRRAQVHEIFDRIVEFSEIGDFIDTPVKNYSSGMYLRLAFSIMVHLEADILLLDEVVSVGDAAFQVKCLEKVRELSARGRTVVIASHNSNELLSICSRVLFLEKGKVRMIGAPMQVVGEYMREASNQADLSLSAREEGLDLPPNQYIFSEVDRSSNDVIRYREIFIHAEGKELRDPMRMNDRLLLTVRVDILQENPDLDIVFQLKDRFYNQISVFSPNILSPAAPPMDLRRPGSYTLQCRFPRNLLKNSRYSLGAAIRRGGNFLHGWPDVVSFVVEAPELGPAEEWFHRAPMTIGPVYEWELVD